jgi:arylformamidase
MAFLIISWGDERNRIQMPNRIHASHPMPEIIDLSPTISPALPVWPGDPIVRLSRVASLESGDAFTLTELAMSAHTGVHVDAPAHYVRGGAGVDALALDILIGPALVADAGDAKAITAGVLETLRIPMGIQRLLLRTRNSVRGLMASSRFHTDFVAVTADGAEWLVTRGVRLVGVDYYSVAPYDALAPTHQILLRAGVVIVEGLDLTAVTPGLYTFICLPLKLQNADGAPARAILLRP